MKKEYLKPAYELDECSFDTPIMGFIKPYPADFAYHINYRKIRFGNGEETFDEIMKTGEYIEVPNGILGYTTSFLVSLMARSDNRDPSIKHNKIIVRAKDFIKMKYNTDTNSFYFELYYSSERIIEITIFDKDSMRSFLHDVGKINNDPTLEDSNILYLKCQYGDII